MSTAVGLTCDRRLRFVFYTGDALDWLFMFAESSEYVTRSLRCDLVCGLFGRDSLLLHEFSWFDPPRTPYLLTHSTNLRETAHL